ncbi:MAG: glycosyl hydrolase family 8 [Pseudomonadota bacterium]
MAVTLPLIVACGTTVDSLGSGTTERQADDGQRPEPVMLQPLKGPASYSNPLREVLGVGKAEIDAKIEDVFRRLFEGDAATERIYIGVGDDQGFVLDVLHGDVRSEGMGYAMMIAVQLDKRDYFDRLWSFARQALPYRDGPYKGYFRSSCMVGGEPEPCVDPFGPQQCAMALIFAHGRWGNDPGRIDYAADAVALLDLMRNRESESDGGEDGVTAMFDAETKLVLDVPDPSAAGRTRPSILMPAYYELWAQATGDEFWRAAAEAARQHWKDAEDETTGLMPLRAKFDGEPVEGAAYFDSEGYRTLINIALDAIWFGKDTWHADNANRLLETFGSPDNVKTSYGIDGEVRNNTPQDPALMFALAATATIATTSNRQSFLTAAWKLGSPTGAPRYYAGLMHLLSLLVSSGQYRVY